MRKIVFIAACMIITLFGMHSTNILGKDIPDLFLNGKLIEGNVVLENATTLVPLRFCSEALQADVNWNKNTQEITITKGMDKVQFNLNSFDYIYNGELKKLSVTPKLINNVTYVPFRPLLESLHSIIIYNNEYKFINIYDPESSAYKVYQALNSAAITTKRFAMLETPRISPLSSIDATSHYYIFPLENPNANYFLEYEGTWEDEAIVSLKYYSIIDGIAINTWGRQVKQYKSSPVDSHSLLKLIGNTAPKDKIEFGVWPNPSDSNFLMFLQNPQSPGVCYLNDIWTEWFLLNPSEVGRKVVTPFSNKQFILFETNDKNLLEKYGSNTQSSQ